MHAQAYPSPRSNARLTRSRGAAARTACTLPSVGDHKLRELERRWRETGAVEHETAYLRERVRVGELTLDRLELAALAGSAACAAVLGRGPGEAMLVRSELERVLLLIGPARLARIAVAIARQGLSQWELSLEFDGRPDMERIRSVVCGAEALILGEFPTAPEDQQSIVLSHRACLLAETASLREREAGTGTHLLSMSLSCLTWAGKLDPASWGRPLVNGLLEAGVSLHSLPDPLRSHVLKGVRDEVLSWALEGSDPFQAEENARRRAELLQTAQADGPAPAGGQRPPRTLADLLGPPPRPIEDMRRDYLGPWP